MMQVLLHHDIVLHEHGEYQYTRERVAHGEESSEDGHDMGRA